MFDTNDIRKGLKIVLDGEPYNVVDFQFVKPGKGRPFTRTKIKNMMTGRVLERTFFSGDRLEPAEMDERQMQFLYIEGDALVFMDSSTYEQTHLTGELAADARHFLAESTVCQVLFYRERPIGVTPPTFVELLVTHCDPGVRGDTASGASKPATLASGYTLQVPLFINEGDWLRIDTRSGEYVERVKK